MIGSCADLIDEAEELASDCWASVFYIPMMNKPPKRHVYEFSYTIAKQTAKNDNCI